MNSIQASLEHAYETLQALSETARLDSEVLLCHVLKKNRAFLRAWPEKKLDPKQIIEFQELVKKRKNGLPIAYLVGIKEFWSREFFVNQHVLIPRPETELLIELALEQIPDNHAKSIIDLGTGSGAIGITLAAERPASNIIATDISKQALDIAATNANNHGITNIKFLVSHWFRQLANEKHHLIISNPPYIDSQDPHLQRGDIRFEPKKALIADRQGLSDIFEIVKTAKNFLYPGGYLIIEHGYNQKQQVQSFYEKNKYTNIASHHDLAGQPRITIGQWQP